MSEEHLTQGAGIDRFMDKYSVYLSSILGLGVALYLATNWENIEMTRRLVGLSFIAIVVHVWEEMRFPGGFIDMVTSNMGLELKNLGIAKMVLFVVEMFVAFVPLFFPSLVWMCMAVLLLGFVETFAHLVATRIAHSKRFYSPGLLTAVFLMLPVSLYGTYYILSNQLMEPIYWLYSVLFLFIPLVIGQGFIVTSNGMKYSDFLQNAQSALFGKRR